MSVKLLGFRGSAKRRRGRKGTVASQALRLAKKNKRTLGVLAEVQQGTTLNAETAFNATPIVEFYVAVGEGEKTLLKNITVRGLIKRNVASDLIDDYRVDLVLDRMPAGVKATVADIYGSANPELGDPPNNLQRLRYKILRTMMGAFGESGNGIAHRVINWNVRLNLVAQSKTANNFGQDQIQKNAVYLVYWTTAAANQPTMRCNGQLYCLDA